MSFERLRNLGFDIEFRNHAHAILSQDFPGPVRDLVDVLAAISIPDVELVRGGGGETPATQRMRKTLSDLEWRKHSFVIRKIVDDTEKPSVTHEIDHVKYADRGAIALEIEWNNKDPFFDRDLENFQRLHSDGVISVGAIVTRGASMQRAFRDIFRKCANTYQIRDFRDLEERFELDPTRRQRAMIAKDQEAGKSFVDSWVHRFTADKYGSATTHWDKLKERLERGVGNPCPLLLVGIPSSAIISTGLEPSD